MSEKNYSTADIQAVANGIRKQILGVALKTGGCYLVMNLGPSVGSWEPIPFPGVPGPDNMDYQRGSSYNGAPAPDKDRFFVSCCHYASVIYAALAETGRISPDCMDKFNVDGWNMEMIGAEHSPGFENTAGSLGQTISIAGGTAHARKRRGDTGKCYVLLGDGELQEGQTWECIQAAGYYKLDNFIVVIDANDQQVEGRIEDQMTEEPLIDRFTSFGAVCVEANGHDIEDFCKACETPHEGKPLVVIARTHGWTGVKPLEKPRSMHFIRIGADERDEFQKIYDEM